MNKKAIELSMNFIVILIISLAVFSMSIMFLTRINGAANDQISMSQSELNSQIENMLLNTDDSLAIPYAVNSIQGSHFTIEVGMKNKVRDGMIYNLTVRLIKANNFDGDDILSQIDPVITYNDNTFEIDKNEIVYRKILFKEMDKKGSYIYQMNLSYKYSSGMADYELIESHIYQINVGK